jgi:single-stranded DNA-binding protein
MLGINNCAFSGYIGRPAELKTSKDGATSYAEFSMAVAGGTRDKPKTTWVRCTVFGKNYMKVIERCNKGEEVYVSGKLDVGEPYLGKTDGQPKVSVNLVVNDWRIVPKADKTQSVETPTVNEELIPF